jgi:hypothetical protein
MGLKEAYQEKADAQLLEWQTRIERIRVDPFYFAARRPLDQQRAVERLDDCYRIARVRLDELRSSQDDRWEFAKQAVERAMIDLKRALDESGTGNAGKILQLNSSREHRYEPFQTKKG